MSVICLVFFLLSTSTAELLIFSLTLCWIMQIDKRHIILGCFQPLFTIFHAAVDLSYGVCLLIEMSPCCSPVCSTSSRSCPFCYICLPLTGCLLVYLVCVCVCVCVSVCARACVRTCMHAFMVCECVCVRAHLHACIYGV